MMDIVLFLREYHEGKKLHSLKKTDNVMLYIYSNM